MESGPNLPLDIIPLICEKLSKRKSWLTSVCLVSKQWYWAAIPYLYGEIRIRNPNIVFPLFETLAANKKLARRVRRLEIRAFPQSMVGIPSESFFDILEPQIVEFFANAQNLTWLVWTRHNTLTRKMFTAMIQLPSLTKLEINGASELLTATDLLSLPSLSSLSLILPDRPTINMLPDILFAQLQSRRPSSEAQNDHYPNDDYKVDTSITTPFTHLSLLGMETWYLTDQVISRCIKHFANLQLQSLTLMGFSRVSDRSLLELVRAVPNIQHLSLESLNISTSFFKNAAPFLSNLRQLTATIRVIDDLETRDAKISAQNESYSGLSNHLIPSATNLQELNLYTSYRPRDQSGGTLYPFLPTSFFSDIRNADNENAAKNLKRLQIHGILLFIDHLFTMPQNTRLAHLAIHLFTLEPFQRLIDALKLPPFRNLRSLQFLSQKSDLDQEQLVRLIEEASLDELFYIGCQNNIYTIRRDKQGIDRLERDNEPWWSERFLVKHA